MVNASVQEIYIINAEGCTINTNLTTIKIS